MDGSGNAYVTGLTSTPGSGFPGTAGSAIQSTYGGGGSDAFVAKISPFVPVTSECSTVISGLTFNRKTQTFQGTIQITNIGGRSLAGPLQMELQDLVAGVTLVNATGMDNGNPYLTTTPSGLAAGASVTVPVSFSNPTRVGINYNVQVFSGN